MTTKVFRIGGMVVLTAIAFAATASAQVSKSGSAYLIRAKYTKGQVLKYNSVSEIDGLQSSGKSPKLVVPITLKVLTMKAGVATVELTMGKIVYEGVTVQPEQKATFPLDNRNRSADSKAQSIGQVLPQKPIKIGATWQAMMPVKIGGSLAPLQGIYTFAGTKMIGGQMMGVITYTLSGPATGTGTLMLIAKDGTMYSNDTRLKMAGPGQVTRIHSIVKRQ